MTTRRPEHRFVTWIRSPAGGGRRGLACAAALLGIAACAERPEVVRAQVQAIEAAQGLDGTAVITPLASGDGLEVDLTGPIHSRMADAVVDALRSARPRRVVLRLDSLGGSEEAAQDMVWALHRVRETHAIVGPGGECTSACLSLWFGVERRFAAPDAVFGFHGAGCLDASLDERRCRASVRRANGKARADIARVAPALLAYLDGISPPALTLPPTAVHLVQGRDMIRLGAALPAVPGNLASGR